MTETRDVGSLVERGLRHFRDGMYPEALEAYSEARKAFLAGGDLLNAAEMLNNIGVIHRIERRKAAAVAALQEAHDSFKELGDLSRAAQALGNIGSVYAGVRERETAIHHYGRAAEIFAELGDGNRQGEVLMALGSVQMKQRQWHQAVAAYHAGLCALERRSLFQRLLLWLLSIARERISL